MKKLNFFFSVSKTISHYRLTQMPFKKKKVDEGKEKNHLWLNMKKLKTENNVLLMQYSLQSRKYQFVFQHLKFLFYWSRVSVRVFIERRTEQWRRAFVARWGERFRRMRRTISSGWSSNISSYFLHLFPLHLKNRNFLIKFSQTKKCFW